MPQSFWAIQVSRKFTDIKHAHGHHQHAPCCHDNSEAVSINRMKQSGTNVVRDVSVSRVLDAVSAHFHNDVLSENHNLLGTVLQPAWIAGKDGFWNLFQEGVMDWSWNAWPLDNYNWCQPHLGSTGLGPGSWGPGTKMNLLESNSEGNSAIISPSCFKHSWMNEPVPLNTFAWLWP